MLSMILTAAAAAAVTLPLYGLDASGPNVYHGVIYAPTPETVSADQAYRKGLIALKNEALRQREVDGGKLTPEHDAAVQRKLDRINLRYAERRRRADLFAVDWSGKAVYSARNRPRVVLPPAITIGAR